MDTEEKRLYTVVLIVSVILAVIIGYFIISIIRQQRKTAQLQKASILAELAAMEKERARIAADLHDDLGPILSVIKFQVDNIQDCSQDDKDLLSQASSHLDMLIGRLREIANNLMPSALHRKGLIVAIEEFTSKAAVSSGLNIQFEHPETLTISDEVSVNIYRSIQEVVHNCIKHSKAAKLEILMKSERGKLTILCRDNGKGFDYLSTANENPGLGLKSLKNRTEIMGGSFTAESKENKGTAYLFEIPTS